MEPNKHELELSKKLSHPNEVMLNYIFDPIQYDGRIKRILKFFYLNNEPLFYLAMSYCTIFGFVAYSILRRKITQRLFSRFINVKSKQKFLELSLNLKRK